jgi:hypothetical protein
LLITNPDSLATRDCLQVTQLTCTNAVQNELNEKSV